MSRSHTVQSSSRGFTLIEAMIVVAIAAILASLAAPGFQNIVANNRLTAGANEVFTGLNVAKSEAIRRNASIRFCINPTTRAWRVLDLAGTEVRVGNVHESLAVNAANLDAVSVADNRCVRFRPDGLSYGTGLITNGSITLSVNGNSRVINIRTGAVYVG